jgi:hypothetical protein
MVTLSPGVYAYHCDAHAATMHGTPTVTGGTTSTSTTTGTTTTGTTSTTTTPADDHNAHDDHRGRKPAHGPDREGPGDAEARRRDGEGESADASGRDPHPQGQTAGPLGAGRKDAEAHVEAAALARARQLPRAVTVKCCGTSATAKKTIRIR